MKNYTMIQNEIAQNSNLSFEARGLLMCMLTFPDDWRFSLNGLINLTGKGRVTVQKYIKELTDAGYLKKEKIRDKGGHFVSYDWIVCESTEILKNRQSEKCTIGNTDSLKNRLSVKPTVRKIDCIQINNINKGINNTKKEKSTKEKTDVFDSILDSLSPELKDIFKEFIKMRKAIKAPLTERALNIAIKKAHELGQGNPETIKAIVEQSILNNWKSFYPLKDSGKAYTAPIQAGETQLERLTRLATERATGGNV